MIERAAKLHPHIYIMLGKNIEMRSGLVLMNINKNNKNQIYSSGYQLFHGICYWEIEVKAGVNPSKNKKKNYVAILSLIICYL